MSSDRSLNSDEERELDEIKSELTDTAESDSFLSPTRSIFLSAPNSPVSAKSVPVSPQSSKIVCISVKQRVLSFESLNIANLSHPKLLIMSGCKKELDPLLKSRRSYKSWVTRCLNGIVEQKEANSLNKAFFNRQEGTINGHINKIEELEAKISDVYDSHSVPPEDGERLSDSDTTYKFILVAQQKLAAIEIALTTAADAPAAAAALPVEGIAHNNDLVAAIANLRGCPTKIQLNCPTFDGNTKDRFQFKHWLAQFECIIEASPNMLDKYKLSVLKSKVSGLASQFIQHLELTAENYPVALDRLKKEYLDIPFIIDELLKQILNKTPGFEPDYMRTRQYLAEIKNMLHDLHKHYEIDLMTADTGGHKLVSHIVFSKLHQELQRAIIYETKTNYPSLNEIFEKSNDVINTIVRTRRKKPETKTEPDGNWKPKKLSLYPDKAISPTLGNFSTQSEYNGVSKLNDNGHFKYHCRFCNIDGHSTRYCNKYKSFSERKNRCYEMGLCVTCSSINHVADKCPGKDDKLYNPCKICSSNQHVSALCPKIQSFPKSTDNHVCLSTGVEGESPYLLPIVSMVVKGPKGFECKFNALLDTGSSRSYLSSHVISKLNCDPKTLTPVDYEVKTFLGSGTKSLKEVTLAVYLPSKRYNIMPLLVDDQFDINLKVKGLSQTVNNFKTKNYKLAADFKDGHNQVHVHGLIGVDAIQFFKDMKIIDCMYGSAFEIASGIIPFGNCEHFLFPSQIRQISKIKNKVENNFNTIVSRVNCP